MILDFIKREFRAILRDSGFLLLAIGAPLFYSLFYPFPYTKDIARNIPVGIVDQDNSYYSRQLAQMMRASEEIQPLNFTTIQEAKQALETNKIFAIAVLHKDFSKNIMKNIPQTVRIYTDGVYPIYYKQATAALQRAIKTMSAGIEIKKLQSLGTGKAAMVLRSPISFTIKNLYSPAGAYRNYLVPAVFVTLVQQIIIIIIGLRAGTLYEKKRRYSPRIKPFQVWLGNIFVYLFFAVMYFIYLFILIYRFYGFSGGTQIITWFLFYMIFSVTTVGLGLTLANIFKERETSVMFLVVTSIPLLFTSGIIWPVWKMPVFIQIARLFVPMTYGIKGVVQIFIMNASLTDILPDVLGCSALAILFCITSYYTVKKRYPTKI
ncbi:MAG: ABC transporter permease [Elusimicrobiaceae bacterium]|nr:ABC transporter permease [Elusimicrobiaceae bacterium]